MSRKKKRRGVFTIKGDGIPHPKRATWKQYEITLRVSCPSSYLHPRLWDWAHMSGHQVEVVNNEEQTDGAT